MRKNSKQGTKPGPIQPEPPTLHQVLDFGSLPLPCGCYFWEGGWRDQHLTCAPAQALVLLGCPQGQARGITGN